MDISTIMGITAAFGLTLLAITVGGGLTWFIDIPVALIVFAGNIGTTQFNNPLKDMLLLMGLSRNAIFRETHPPQVMMKEIVASNQVTRR